MKVNYLLNVLVFSVLCFPGIAQNQNASYNSEIKEYRKAYKEKFLNAPNSPLSKKDLKCLKFFKSNPSFKVIADFERTDDEQPFKMPTYNGDTHDYIKFGNLKFELRGQKMQLSVYQILWMQRIPGKQYHLFVPFKDLTNREKTYGGGRYLDLSIQDISESKIVVDFNKCYNPYCAYSDGFSCPIPPSENNLEIEILAGEKDFKRD